MTSLSDYFIYINGPNSLQNSLMASFLSQATGARCMVIDNALEIPRREDDSSRDKNLALWDWLGKDVQICLFDQDLQGNEIVQHSVTAFFNVPRGLGIEETVVGYGAEGVFYERDSMETLEKGVRAILGGELWISRKVLSDYIRRNSRRNLAPMPGTKNTGLTPREKEILLMLVSGAKRTDIADKLFISSHTVRTHLYNLYKKIRVKNRIEAILWVSKNL